jgi:hypothetical protein
MGLAGVSLGRELRALALSHTASVRLRCGVAPPENSVTNSCADCALTDTANARLHHKAISPCVSEERVGTAVPGLAHRVGAEWRGAQNGCSRTGRTRWTALPPF